jgi:hypothetical protein
MAKPPANHGKQWTPAEVKQLKQLAQENTPTRVIGLKLGRTADAVRAKAGEKQHLPQAHQPVALHPAQALRRKAMTRGAPC